MKLKGIDLVRAIFCAVVLLGLLFAYIKLTVVSVQYFWQKHKCNEQSEQVSEQPQKPTVTMHRMNDHEVTFYCPNVCTGQSKCRTATGTVPTPQRTLAVDPRYIELGSKVHVEGFGILIAEDTGLHIKGNRLDVYVADCSQARQLGRQTLKVHKIIE